MLDAVDELITYRMQQGKVSATLRRVHRFHKRNPQVLDFLTLEMRAEMDSGWDRTSLGSLWHYSRWVLTRIDRLPGETFAMSNNLFPWYGRIIAILHPDLNGFFGMNQSAADLDLGTALEPLPVDRKPRYIRRLTWAGGTPIERGWRPTTPHEPKPVRRRERVRRVA